MVEMAFCMTFLLLVLIGVLFFGRYFLLAQVLLHAAQEEAKIAARTPNLNDENTREMTSGFTTTGTAVNPQSVIYGALASAQLLSQGTSGDMPPGSRVEILPWDSDGTAADNTTPQGTVQVRIDYPFQLLGNPFTGQSQSVAIAMTVTGSNPPLRFGNFTITERAVAAQEIYQQQN